MPGARSIDLPNFGDDVETTSLDILISYEKIDDADYAIDGWNHCLLYTAVVVERWRCYAGWKSDLLRESNACLFTNYKSVSLKKLEWIKACGIIPVFMK